MSSFDRDGGLVSEMALSAQSLGDFERVFFEYLRPIVGFDAVCSVWSGGDGAVRTVTAPEYGAARMREEFPGYMSELSPAELQGFAGPRPAVDLDVVSRQRRGSLSVYRELLAPLHVAVFVTNVWHSRFGVFGFHFARMGLPCRFRASELRRLEQILPSMKLAQALHAAEGLSENPAPRVLEPWEGEWGLTRRERETARLVLRGFRNAEIASILRMSPNTVRNHLASIFRKADVSTRAELAFAMTSAEPGGAGQARGSRAEEPWSAPLLATARRRGRSA
ncbi:MAG TPA: helix-turn-helix transcriptional regulator [Polyangiaceae bacterium]|jgi:DNA-binding CsgD family transcriptional regulator|nr:helix-turn-helix transcriptional regulator [Polyangiaceae bacterium]